MKYAECWCSLFLFNIFRLEIHFLGKFRPKNQNCQFRKFVTKTNSNMQNSMVMFPFSVFERKYFFRQIWSKILNCQFKLKFGIRVSPSGGDTGGIPRLPKRLVYLPMFPHCFAPKVLIF